MFVTLLFSLSVCRYNTNALSQSLRTILSLPCVHYHFVNCVSQGVRTKPHRTKPHTDEIPQDKTLLDKPPLTTKPLTTKPLTTKPHFIYNVRMDST